MSMVQVISIAIEPLASARLMQACLPPLEHQRASTFRHEDDRARYVLGRSVLRLLLGSALGLAPQQVPIAYAARGKPALPATLGAPHFNVSHSGAWVMIALAATPVGIDVEQHRLIDHAALSTHIFGAAERRQIAEAADPVAAFFRYWVVKEAWLKAAGLGLADMPTLSDMSGLDPDSPTLTGWARIQCDPALPAKWVARLQPGQGYCAAVCVDTPAVPPPLQQSVWSPDDLQRALDNRIKHD